MNLVCIGNISYWKKLVAADESILYVAHTYQKQSVLSQYDIMAANGVLKLSVPTKKSTRKGAYELVEIDYQSAWQTEHWRSIDSAYKKSPFFLYYGYKIEEVYKKNYLTLMEFNLALFECMKACIKWEVNHTVEDEKIVYLDTNLQNDILPVYPQVFDHKHAFASDLSILDLLFNLGPETLDYLGSSVASV